MAHIEVLESGYVDRADSAFPTLVALDTGEIVCGFSRGGGPYATGDTHCARSADGCASSTRPIGWTISAAPSGSPRR